MKKFLRQYEILLHKAKQDLIIAEVLLKSEEIEVEGVMFHLQQCAEKCIKVLLSFHDIHFEKIHDIEKLIDMCKENKIVLPDYANDFIALSGFAVMGRYGFITDRKVDTKNYVQLLEKFVTYINKALRKKEH